VINPQRRELPIALQFGDVGVVVRSLFGSGRRCADAHGANAPPWDFGRLLGVYVAFFFVVAQLISWLGFGQKPTPMILLGGALIVIGGCVVSLAK